MKFDHYYGYSLHPKNKPRKRKKKKKCWPINDQHFHLTNQTLRDAMKRYENLMKTTCQPMQPEQQPDAPKVHDKVSS